MSLSQIQRLEKHLQTRVGNIRSYVVKHTDPDQFLLEALQSKDVGFSKNAQAGDLFREVLKERVSSQREQLQKATNSNSSDSICIGGDVAAAAADNKDNNNDDDPLLILQRALEKAQAGVPPPTRNDSKQIEGSLRHLDKMRAASQAIMTYWTLPGNERLATAPRDTLKKIHDVVQDGTTFVLEAVKELEKEKSRQRQYGSGSGSNSSSDLSAVAATTTTDKAEMNVSLQDAWSKTIELPSVAPVAVAVVHVGDENNSDGNSSSSSNKRLRTNSYKPYYKVRMLFRPKRKTPQPLLSAIRRKGAQLRMAANSSSSSSRSSNCNNTNSVHLVLDFDEAFTMTIYFSPLTVTLRARTPEDNNNAGASSSSSSTNSDATVTWRPLSYGLTPWGSTKDSSDYRHDHKERQERQLSVWGVTSNYDSIGRVVEERLRDASTHATAVLRKCFQNHVKDKLVDFEVELLEGSALLEFLQLARATYMPQWEDMDV